jgi:hypothetical protein
MYYNATVWSRLICMPQGTMAGYCEETFRFQTNAELLDQLRNCRFSETTRMYWVETRWNVMEHGDARKGKWRGNWRMQWVASTLNTTSEHGVYSITTAEAHTSAATSPLNWRPRRFKWNRPFRRKTKSGFCACAITFQTQSTSVTASHKPRHILTTKHPLFWDTWQSADRKWSFLSNLKLLVYILTSTLNKVERMRKGDTRARKFDSQRCQQYMILDCRIPHFSFRIHNSLPKGIAWDLCRIVPPTLLSCLLLSGDVTL